MSDNENDYAERVKQANKRMKERMITLRELLVSMEPESPLPDEWKKWDDFSPGSVFRINLCFMSEEDTWIKVYRDHVILIPFYDCKVAGFNPGDEKYSLNVWLYYDEFIPELIRRNKDV